MDSYRTWHRTVPNFPEPKDQTDSDLFDAMEMLITQGKIEWALDDEGQMLFRSTSVV